MKEANRYMKIFREKKSFGQFDFLGYFLLFDWAWLKLSQATVTVGSLNSQDMISFMTTTGSLNSQDIIRIFKQSWYGFLGKHLSMIDFEFNRGSYGLFVKLL